MSRGEVYLGDLIDGYRVLRPRDEETLDALARCFGFRSEQPVRARPKEEGGRETQPEDRRHVPESEPITWKPRGDERASPSRESTSRADLAWVTALSKVGSAPQPSTDANPLPESSGFRSPSVESLLEPQWARAILAALARVSVPEGDLDVERVVERRARMKPVGALPRLPSPTLRFGVEVLVDVSSAMAPYAADVQAVLRELARVIGRGPLVRRIEGTPRRYNNPGGRFTTYRPKYARAPLWVLSDLGVAEDLVDVMAWRRLALACNRFGRNLVALVPWSRGECPVELVDVLPMIQWDRGTSINDIPRRRP